MMVFKKGESGNRAGRPVGAKGKYTNSFLDKMIEIEEKVAKEKGISLLEHFVRACHTDKYLLAQYLKKIVADRNYLTDKGDGSVPNVKVVFEVIDTPYSFIERNKAEIQNILIKVKTGKLEIEEAFIRLGEIQDTSLKNDHNQNNDIEN